MIPLPLPELSELLRSADQYLEHTNDGAVGEAETVLAALRRILENRIGTQEILHALTNPLASAEVKKTTLPTLEGIANKEPETKRNLYNVQPLSPTPPESEIGDALASVHFVPPLSFAELAAIEDRALKVPLHKLD